MIDMNSTITYYLNTRLSISSEITNIYDYDWSNFRDEAWAYFEVSLVLSSVHAAE